MSPDRTETQRPILSSAEEMVATLPGIVWEADATDRRMTYVSPRARDLLGHDADAWVTVAEFWEDHLHPDDRERAMTAMDHAVDKLASVTVEYRFADAGGSYHHCRDIARVVERPDGHRHIVGFMLDVTEEASATSERRLLAAAVENASESVRVTDRDGIVLYVNPAFERLTGYASAEVVGRNMSMLAATVRPADRAWRLAAAGAGWSGDLAVRRKDGSVYSEEASVTPVIDADGTVRHVVAVGRDVTVERAERERTARLAAIVESAADAGYANDLHGIYLAWNDAAARIYGWTADEVLGRSVFDLVAPEEHPNIRSWLDRVAAGETVGPSDARHRGRDGRILTLSVTASPVRGANGRVTGIATIARDVSEERRLTTERLELETRLLQAQKLEAIGRLAGGLAHDFNNMLTAIRGYAMLVAGSLDGPQRADQEQVLRAVDRAADLTRRLLAFTRAAPVDPRPVDLDAVLSDAYRMVGRLVPERIEFELVLGSGCRVHADPAELEQLLLNLVINAADAIRDAGRIEVRTRVATGAEVPADLDRERRWAALTVTDTGVGMDDVVRSRIFEPFYTTKLAGEGTGLGLATVMSIVRHAGGTIAVATAPGDGTAFEVFLPVTDAAASTPEHAPAALGGIGERVLVVDDSEVIAVLAARILEDAGYRATVATDPAAVLAHGTGDVDVILSDVIMPGMSGVELVARLGGDLPVVFMSGYTGPELPEDLRIGPTRAFVDKPFTNAVLLGAIRDVLDASGSRGPGPGLDHPDHPDDRDDRVR